MNGGSFRVMTLAALDRGDFGYDLLLLLHVAAVVVGFGSSFVYPFLGVQAKARGGVEAKALSESSIDAAKKVTTPVIYVAAILGVILVAVSDQWEFSDAWVGISMVVVVASILFAAFVHVPNVKVMDRLTSELAAMGPPPPGAAPSGPPPQVAELDARGKRAGMNGGILHLAFLVVLYLMIFKPGA